MSTIERADVDAWLARMSAIPAPTPEQIAETERKEREHESRQQRETSERWGVPARLLGMSSQLKDTRAMLAVHEWATGSRDRWCLVLSATKGVGKTFAAAWWLHGLAVGKSAQAGDKRFWSASELMRMDGYGAELDKVARASCLVIDDLGVEYNDAKGAFLAKLDAVIDARYANLRRTIITTNLSHKLFSERYGERIADRLNEGGTWRIINGTSIRGIQS